MDMINNLARKVAPVIMLVLLVSLLLTSCGSTSTKTGEITPEEYDDIRNGMTYEEVCQIIGGEPIKIELASSTDSILLETVENQKHGIDKQSFLDSETKEKIKTGLDELAKLYLNGEDYEQSIYYNDDDIRGHWISILFAYTKSEVLACDKYTWQGKKINENAEYRGYAVISFENGKVTNKSCKDLE